MACCLLQNFLVDVRTTAENDDDQFIEDAEELNDQFPIHYVDESNAGKRRLDILIESFKSYNNCPSKILALPSLFIVNIHMLPSSTL
jgi:hypothetical protein